MACLREFVVLTLILTLTVRVLELLESRLSRDVAVRLLKIVNFVRNFRAVK